MKSIKVSVPGKVILTGEHAVVYGSLAVAASINIRSFVSLNYAQEPHKIIVIHNKSQEVLEWAQLSKHVNEASIIGVICTFVMEVMKIPCYLEFLLENRLPIGKGLGSSAAFCVGVSAVLLVIFIKKSQGVESLEEVNNLAFFGENLLHGKASGIDNTTVTYGGLITYQLAATQRINLPLARFTLLLIDSQIPKNTKTMVENLRQKHQSLPLLYNKLFESINVVSESFLSAAKDSNSEQIKELLKINHGILRCLGVSSKELDDIVETAQKFGIRGKMTGGGGGGVCVFLTTDENLEGFTQACESKGWGVLLTEFSEKGIEFI